MSELPLPPTPGRLGSPRSDVLDDRAGEPADAGLLHVDEQLRGGCGPEGRRERLR